MRSVPVGPAPVKQRSWVLTTTTGRIPERHIGRELGLSTRLVGEELHSTGVIVPQMHVPGVGRLRTSVLAFWADSLAGRLAAQVVAPRVPVTLYLDVHLYQPLPASGVVHGVAAVIRAGRSVFSARADFTADGVPLATADGTFMVAPDPRVRLPESIGVDLRATGQLAEPLADRARCERRHPGVAALARSEDGLNSAGTIHGGLLALAAEESALSLAPGETLSSLSMRYHRAARIGPVIATATLHGRLGRVELHDSGDNDRLVATAVARTSG